jgi:hypothetical protein
MKESVEFYLKKRYEGREYKFMKIRTILERSGAVEIYFESPWNAVLFKKDATKIKKEIKNYYLCHNVRFFHILTIDAENRLLKNEESTTIS